MEIVLLFICTRTSFNYGTVFMVDNLALGFLCMHIVTGLLVSIVFQIAHIMPDVDFPLPDKMGLWKTNGIVIS